MPTALREISVEAMWELLGKTEEDTAKAFTNLPNIPAVKDKESNKYKRYVAYLNLLSDTVHKKTLQSSEEVIHFFDRHGIPAKDHATGTINRPDFLALKTAPGECAPLVFHWSALEATGGLLSGDDQEYSRVNTAAYTSYHLQARPDMVIVQGIYIDPHGFRLVASNACGAFDTEHLAWGERPARLLLCAWIWRLYEPFVDPSMTVNIERDKPATFEITLPQNTYRNCTVHSVGTAFGRRTIVLACPEPEIVIKEQYIETSGRFEEGPILTKIHQNGTFPGVVRPGWYGPVRSSKEEELVVGWEESERRKTRVILLDKASSIMDAKTLRDALVAIYDLLEITRFLHKKRKILHRDISCNNVLLRDVVPLETSSADNDPLAAAVAPEMSSTDNDLPTAAVLLGMSSTDNDLLAAAVPAKLSIAEELKDMCFASHLLRAKSKSNPGRLDTGVLLIDFDMSEDQDPSNQGDDAQTGTSTFIARAVVSGMQREGRSNLEPMPELGQEAKVVYQETVPQRLTEFPPNKLEIYEIPEDVPLKPFKHKLQYDAESVFWLLLWWAIHACPMEDTSSAHRQIDERVWDALTSQQDAEMDPREIFVYNFPTNVLHSLYKPLERLLRDMAQQLRGDHDHEGIEDQSRKQDDYLHEAFQRLIFNFLFTHYDEDFMTAKKAPDFRTPAKEPPMEGPLSSHRINQSRASAASSSQKVQLPPAYDFRPSSSHKRKRGHGEAFDSDPNDGDYVNKSKRHK